MPLPFQESWDKKKIWLYRDRSPIQETNTIRQFDKCVFVEGNVLFLFSVVLPSNRLFFVVVVCLFFVCGVLGENTSLKTSVCIAFLASVTCVLLRFPRSLPLALNLTSSHSMFSFISGYVWGPLNSSIGTASRLKRHVQC